MLAIHDMVYCFLLTLDSLQLLVPLVSTFRYEGDEVNMLLAKSEAKILHEKISDKKYNDEEVIRILSTRSKAQLNATINHYNNAFGNAINKVLKLFVAVIYLIYFSLILKWVLIFRI